jgi:hypothetical protein
LVVPYVSFTLTLLCCGATVISRLEAHTQECFIEQHAPGTSCSVQFEVRQGAALDIDLDIFDTMRGTTIYSIARKQVNRGSLWLALIGVGVDGSSGV